MIINIDKFIEDYQKTNETGRILWKGKDFTETTVKIEVKKLGVGWKVEKSPYEKGRFVIVKEKAQMPLEEYKKEYGEELSIIWKQFNSKK